MTERVLKLTKEVLDKLPQEHKFELINVIGSGELYEMEYSLRMNFISPNQKKCCILILKDDLSRLKDNEIIGAIVHELAHYLSPEMTKKERRYYLLAHTNLNIEKYRKIGGSRKFQSLKKLKQKLEKEIDPEREELDKMYKKEEDATDLRAISWGFEEEIAAMRKISEKEVLSFRFVHNV